MVQRAELKGAHVSVDGQAFRETMAYVLPRRDEVKWQEIPWQTDLWTARRLACRARRTTSIPSACPRLPNSPTK